MTHRTAGAALSLLLCTPALVWTADLLADTPLLILAAATAPAVLVAAFILFAQRGGNRRAGALVLALAWGALVAAFLASTGNELARSWIGGPGADARHTTATVLAPVLEECVKALGFLPLLYLSRASFRDARDGIIYGALIGAGFVWTENFLYLGVSMLQSGEEGLMRAIFLRGILGAAAHAVFTASSGAAAGYAASRAGRAIPRLIAFGGLIAAVVQHVVWNALAAPSIARALCGASSDGGGACVDRPSGVAVFGFATAIAAIFLAPGVAVLVKLWRRSGIQTVALPSNS